MVGNEVIARLARDNPNMTDIDRLVNIYWAVREVTGAKVPGALAELGCNEGKTSVFLQLLLCSLDPSRELHVYDSFEGLPKPGPADTYLQEGMLRVSVEDLAGNFRRWGLPTPAVHKGWFEDTLGTQLPDTIAFAYFDSDFYDSVLTSWRHVYPRLAPGAIVLVDDYCDREKNPNAWDGLPGVKKACDEFLADKPEQLGVLVGSGDLAMGLLQKTGGPIEAADDPAREARA